MAVSCVVCGRPLTESEVKFSVSRCAVCTEARPERTAPSVLRRGAGGGVPEPTGGGIGAALAGLAGFVVARIIVGAVFFGIAALIGVFCYTDVGDRIRGQNEAAAGGTSDVLEERTGKVDIFDLRTGNCLSESEASNFERELASTEVTLVPCSSPSAFMEGHQIVYGR